MIGSGGALLNSRILQRIVADTLGVALYPSHDQEASARGAALLALEALGYDLAQVTSELGQPLLPDEQHGTIYQAAAARQQALYQKLLE